MIAQDLKMLLLLIVLKALGALLVMALFAVGAVKLQGFGKSQEYTKIEISLAMIVGLLVGIGLIVALK